MNSALILVFLTGAYIAAPPVPHLLPAAQHSNVAHESRIPVGNSVQFVCTEIGSGPPVIVLHGGPDFDHRYLLPELDDLADSYHLIYYDQRGHGRSADGVRPEDVTLDSDIADIEKVREYFKLD